MFLQCDRIYCFFIASLHVLTTMNLHNVQHLEVRTKLNEGYIQGEYKLSEDFAKQYFHKY
jgi:hypothetical protein